MKYFSKYPFIEQDIDARSLSFFCNTDLTYVNNELISELKSVVDNEGENVRVSLHSSPDNLLHDMILAQGDYTYNRPHKHTHKAETYHILYGEQIVFIFNDDGTVRETFCMSRDENMVYRFEKETYHMTLPLSKCVVFHENKIGPFAREGDSLFASWAPESNDKDAVNNYIESLKTKFVKK